MIESDRNINRILKLPFLLGRPLCLSVMIQKEVHCAYVRDTILEEKEKKTCIIICSLHLLSHVDEGMTQCLCTVLFPFLYS
jgi:hypothetical protein